MTKLEKLKVMAKLLDPVETWPHAGPSEHPCGGGNVPPRRVIIPGPDTLLDVGDTLWCCRAIGHEGPHVAYTSETRWVGILED